MMASNKRDHEFVTPATNPTVPVRLRQQISRIRWTCNKIDDIVPAVYNILRDAVIIDELLRKKVEEKKRIGYLSCGNDSGV